MTDPLGWDDVAPTAAAWADRLAPVAASLRPAAAAVLAAGPAGVWADPAGGLVLQAPDPDAFAALKAAALVVVPARFVRPTPLAAGEPDRPGCRLVKLAHSPAVRALTDALHLTPGEYPGVGLPTHPSPLAAMLAGGLLMGGLGYAGGRLARAALPDGYGDKLPRTGALAGAALGALPGAVWGATSLADGHGLTDPWPHGPAGPAAEDPVDVGPIDRAVEGLLRAPRPGAAAAARKLAAAGVFGGPAAGADVYLPGLARLAADPAADPRLAAATVGAVLAAARMPAGREAPGWVTAEQFGRLGLAAAGSYATGLLAGAVLNRVVGTPHSAPAFGTAAAGLAVAGAVVPRLFGR